MTPSCRVCPTFRLIIGSLFDKLCCIIRGVSVLLEDSIWHLLRTWVGVQYSCPIVSELVGILVDCIVVA